jgi:hypothetical protein
MPVNIEEYLSEGEMKNIAREAFTAHCAEVFRKDHERIFGNVAHKMVWDEVDKLVDGDITEAIAKRVAEIIPQISEYTVFRAKGIYDREESPGQTALRAAVNRHAATLGERVAYLAGEITKQDVIDMLLDSDLTLQISAK